MTVIVRTESEINRRVEDVFDALLDYSRWASFMPGCFRALLGPRRALRQGDRVLVLVPTGPAILRIRRVRPHSEICWGGGIPGVIVAEHAFFFDDLGNQRTKVRSEERFDGALLRIDGLRRMGEHEALVASDQILAGLKAFLKG